MVNWTTFIFIIYVTIKLKYRGANKFLFHDFFFILNLMEGKLLYCFFF
jgi:hypothetical protein